MKDMQQVPLDKHNFNNTDIAGISDIWNRFWDGKKSCHVTLKTIKAVKRSNCKYKHESYFQFSILYRVFVYIFSRIIKYMDPDKRIKIHSQVAYKKVFISAYSLTSSWAPFPRCTIQVHYYVFESTFRVLLHSFQRENCFRILTM